MLVYWVICFFRESIIEVRNVRKNGVIFGFGFFFVYERIEFYRGEMFLFEFCLEFGCFEIVFGK